MPGGPIVVDKQRQLVDVVGGLRNILGVSFALIPDGSANTVGATRWLREYRRGVQGKSFR
jgi:hypothetical protein